MLSKSKRLILGLFIIFLTNDFCQYIRVFMEDIEVTRFEIFYSLVRDKTIFNTAIIFICIISVFKFIKYFFNED